MVNSMAQMSGALVGDIPFHLEFHLPCPLEMHLVMCFFWVLGPDGLVEINSFIPRVTSEYLLCVSDHSGSWDRKMENETKS